MRVESVLPFSNLANFLVTVFVLFIIVGPRRIIDIVPILWYLFEPAILLTLLPATALSFFSSIEVIDIVIGGPIGKCGFWRRWLSWRSWRIYLLRCWGCSNGGRWSIRYR